MSYSNTGLRCVVPSVSGGPAIWIYTSADAHGDVDAANYFSDGADFGLKANDVVIVIDTNVPTCTIHAASSATTIRAATLT